MNNTISIRNEKIYNLISTTQAESQMKDLDDSVRSRTELDRHANMPVVGRHSFVLAESGKTIDVNPFTPDYKPLQVLMVEAAVKYVCPFEGKEHILIIQNALHVPKMENNLLPPFMMREAGI